MSWAVSSGAYRCPVTRVVSALFSGALLCLAHPPVGWWWAALPALAGLAWALRGGIRARFAFVVGLVGGLAFFVPTLSWAGIYVGWLPWFALASLEALFVGLLGVIVALATHRRDQVRPGVFALAWVLTEYLRSVSPYGGFPWVKLAFSQVDGPLVRLASTGGTVLVSGVVAALGALLAVGVRALVHRRSGPTGWLRPLGVLSLGLLLPLAVPVPDDGPLVHVLGVQGNVPRAGLDFNAQRRAVLDNHVGATLEAARQVAAGSRVQPELVIWPENASDIDPLRNADANALIRDAATQVKAPLIIGGLLEEPADAISNASLMFLPGQPGPLDTQRYVKRHPVPFAEYIPQRDFFRHFSDKVDLVSRNFAAGPSVGLMTSSSAAGQVRSGLLICFEVAYDDLVRDTISAGANLLVVQTNNATFGYSAESQQQLSISRFRALEQGRSVVHVSTVGVSALVTPDGVAHQSTELYTQALLSGALPLRSTTTVAARLGSAPEWLVGAATLFLVIRGMLLRRRAPKADAPHTPEPRSA